MYQIKVTDEFIYNKNKDIALKLSSKSIFSGDNLPNTSGYPYFEIWLMQSPHCRFSTYSNNFDTHEGDVLVFSKEDSKEIVYADNNAVFLSLQIDGAAYGELLPLRSMFEEHNFFGSHSGNFKNKIPSVNPIAKLIKESIYKIGESFNSKRLGYETEIIRISLDILLTIARDTNYLTASETSTVTDNYSKSHKALKKVIDYIDAHLNEELTLERISSVAELSPNYFSNVFREQTGVKLWDYISEKRVLLATQLLVEFPDDSIISVALKCGFNNCPNFNRAFKKYTGQTPKKYKTSILRQEET